MVIRWFATVTFRILPASAPGFIYRRILSPKMIRNYIHTVLGRLAPNELQISEGTLFLNHEDPVISGALGFGVYEPFETELFRSTLRPGMIVLDIGANIGYYSLIAGVRVGITGCVHSFEPELANFTYLQKNITANNLQNVNLHKIAVSDRHGSIDLHLFKSNKGRHSVVTPDAESTDYDGFVRVTSERLDTMLTLLNVSAVDIIKVDIEGAEARAISGMHKTLAIARIIFIEFSPESIRRDGSDPLKMLYTIAEHGFKILEINESRRSLDQITNLQTYTRRFSGEEYSNLLCTKVPIDALV